MQKWSQRLYPWKLEVTVLIFGLSPSLIAVAAGCVAGWCRVWRKHILWPRTAAIPPTGTCPLCTETLYSFHALVDKRREELYLTSCNHLDNLPLNISYNIHNVFNPQSPHILMIWQYLWMSYGFCFLFVFVFFLSFIFIKFIHLFSYFYFCAVRC